MDLRSDDATERPTAERASGRLILGDFHPHLESAFAERLAELSPRGDARNVLVVVPNRFLAVHLRRRAAELGTPTFGLTIRALEDLAAELAGERLAQAGIRPMAGWQGAMLLAEILAPRLRGSVAVSPSYFAPLADQGGLYRAIYDTLRDLSDALIDPRDLENAVAGGRSGASEAAGSSRKLVEVAQFFRLWRAELERRGLADSRIVTEAATASLRESPSTLPGHLLVYGLYDLVPRQRKLLAAALEGRRADVFFPWSVEQRGARSRDGGPAFAYAAPLRFWFEDLGFAPESANSSIPSDSASDPESESESESESGVAEAAEENHAPSDLDRLRRTLFSDSADRPESNGRAEPRPARFDGSVRLLSTPNPQREALEVVRAMVADLRRSNGVLLRREDQTLPAFLDIERRAGLPLHTAGGEPWSQSPAGRALRLLLRLAGDRRHEGEDSPESLSRATVEDLLGSGALNWDLVESDSMDGRARPERWPQLLRRLGMVSGLPAWRRLVDRHGSVREGSSSDAAEPSPSSAAGSPASSADAGSEDQGGSMPSGGHGDDGESDERDPVLARELPHLAAWVDRLLEDTARLSRDPESWSDFHDRVIEVAERWLTAESGRREVLESLQSLAQLDGVLRCEFATAVEAVTTLLDRQRRPDSERFGEAPTLADLMTLRGVTFDRVVIPGMVERAFPRRARQDPILLDDERQAINDRLSAGNHGDLPWRRLPLKVEDAVAEERLLLRLAIASARKELIVSWHRMTEEGQGKVPSSFLLEIAGRLVGRDVDFADLAGERGDGLVPVEHVPLAPGFPTEADRPLLFVSELDLSNVARVRHPEHFETRPGFRPRPPASLSYLLDAFPFFGSARRMAERRYGFEFRHRLTEYDGIVPRNLAQAWLASRRVERSESPSREKARQWPSLGVSSLEHYAGCGFRFFHDHVLGLTSESPPERQLDLDRGRLGMLYHRVLADLFQQLDQEGLLPLVTAALPRAEALARAIVRAIEADRPVWLGEVPNALWRARRRRLLRDVNRVLEQEAAADDGWTPVEFEFAFGGRSDAAPPTLDAAGRTIALSGRVDRVDHRIGHSSEAGEAGSVPRRIVDYKTGALRTGQWKAGDLCGGERMQLALYRQAMAQQAQVEPADVEGVYTGVESSSGYRRVVWNREDFEATAEEFRAIVDGVVGGIARGELFQVERGLFCDRYCTFGEICGPERKRLLEDKQLAPEAQRAARWRFPGRFPDQPPDEADLDGPAGETR